jgi:hypothetical protein
MQIQISQLTSLTNVWKVAKTKPIQIEPKNWGLRTFIMHISSMSITVKRQWFRIACLQVLHLVNASATSWYLTCESSLSVPSLTNVLMVLIMHLQVDRKTTISKTYCSCRHLTTFGGGFAVQPNKIDFAFVFSHASFTQNMTLYLMEIAAATIYILLFIWCRRQDKKDLLKVDRRLLHKISFLTLLYNWASGTAFYCSMNVSWSVILSKYMTVIWHAEHLKASHSE